MLYRSLRRNQAQGLIPGLIPGLGLVLTVLCPACVVTAGDAHAALNVNPPQTITERVRIQPIIVSNDDGSNTAAYMGSATQMMEMELLVDEIWAQAGIDVAWLTPTVWHNTWANLGTAGNGTRSTSDLFTMVLDGDAAGVGNSDHNIIDMYFVEVVPGFTPQSDNVANGLARVGGNGISMHMGDNLPGSQAGREAASHVLAHEIGHNFGLLHNDIPFNLLLPGNTNRGEQVNAEQTARSLNSRFSVPLDALPVVLGDLNDNGVADALDLSDLVLALTRPDTFAAQSTVDPNTVGDLNSDGAFNLDDLRVAADTLPQYGRPEVNRAQNYTDLDLALDALDDGVVNGSDVNLFETQIVTGKMYESGDSRGDYSGPSGTPDGVIDAWDIDYLFSLQSAAVVGDLQTVSLLLGELAVDADGDGLFGATDAMIVGGFTETPDAAFIFDHGAWIDSLVLQDDFRSDFRFVPEPAGLSVLLLMLTAMRRRR